MKTNTKIKFTFIMLLFLLETLFGSEPITIGRIPSRIKLFETINLNFKVNQNKVKEYRYRLRVPGDWLGGIKYLSNNWSEWQNNSGKSILLKNFSVEGSYKFEIQYKEYNSRRTKTIVKKFKAYWEYPEVRLKAFNIDNKVWKIKDKKKRYKILANEFYESYQMWNKKYQYEFKRLKLTTSADEIKNKIGATISKRVIDNLVENLAGSAATKWLGKVFAPKTLYDIVKEGSLTLVLIMRNREANEAAFMTVLTYHLYQKCLEKSY